MSTKAKIDPDENFEEWLKSHKATQGLIKKMKQHDMDSTEMLQQIDANDKETLKEVADEMGLTTTERLRFKVIWKAAIDIVDEQEEEETPQEPEIHDVPAVIYPEEREAILAMEAKLKQIEDSILKIEEAKKKVTMEVEKCTDSITKSYDEIQEEIVKAVVSRKEELLKKLEEISNEKMVELDKAYQEMKQHSIKTSSHITTCYDAVNKKVDLNQMDRRKTNILTTAAQVDTVEIIDSDHVLIKSCEISFNLNKEGLFKYISKCGRFKTSSLDILDEIDSDDQILSEMGHTPYGGISKAALPPSLKINDTKNNSAMIVITRADDEHKNVSQYKLEFAKSQSGKHEDDQKLDWKSNMIKNTGKRIEWELKGLYRNCTYLARIKSKNENGWGRYSKPISFTTKNEALPPTLRYTKVTDHSAKIIITRNKDEMGCIEHKLEYMATKGDVGDSGVSSGDDSTYDDDNWIPHTVANSGKRVEFTLSGLLKNTTYVVRGQSRNQGGWGRFGDYIGFETNNIYPPEFDQLKKEFVFDHSGMDKRKMQIRSDRKAKCLNASSIRLKAGMPIENIGSNKHGITQITWSIKHTATSWFPNYLYFIGVVSNRTKNFRDNAEKGLKDAYGISGYAHHVYKGKGYFEKDYNYKALSNDSRRYRGYIQDTYVTIKYDVLASTLTFLQNQVELYKLDLPDDNSNLTHWYPAVSLKDAGDAASVHSKVQIE